MTVTGTGFITSVFRRPGGATRCAGTNSAGGAMDVCKGSSQDARHDHLEGRSFYTALGYADDDVLVVEKFLNGQSENLNPRCLF